MLPSMRYIPLLILGHISAVLVTAVLINVTVDDQGTDPRTGAAIAYTPTGGNTWNIGQDCNTCATKPNPLNAKDGTWHDATYFVKQALSKIVTFEFTGSALYIFGIIAQNNPNTESGGEYLFFIDEEPVGQSSHSPSAPSNSPPFLYDQVLYFNDSIPVGKHMFKLQNGELGGDASLILFDYLIYSTDDGLEPSVPSPPPVPSPTSDTISFANRPTTFSSSLSSSLSLSSSFTSTSTYILGGSSTTLASASRVSALSSSLSTSSSYSAGSVNTTHSPTTTTDVDPSSALPSDSVSKLVSNPTQHATLSPLTRTLVICLAVVLPCLFLIILFLLYLRRRRIAIPQTRDIHPLSGHYLASSVDNNPETAKHEMVTTVAGPVATHHPYGDEHSGFLLHERRGTYISQNSRSGARSISFPNARPGSVSTHSFTRHSSIRSNVESQESLPPPYDARGTI